MMLFINLDFQWLYKLLFLLCFHKHFSEILGEVVVEADRQM